MSGLKQYFTQEDTNTTDIEADDVQVAEPTVAEIEPAEDTEDDVQQAPATSVANEDLTAEPYTPLSAERVEELLAARPHPETTMNLASLESRIREVYFNHLVNAAGTGKSFTCTIVLDNGFEVVGVSHVADPRNLNPELGKHYAYQKALKELFPIAVFMQCEAAMTVSIEVPVESERERGAEEFI